MCKLNFVLLYKYCKFERSGRRLATTLATSLTRIMIKVAKYKQYYFLIHVHVISNQSGI